MPRIDQAIVFGGLSELARWGDVRKATASRWRLCYGASLLVWTCMLSACGTTAAEEEGKSLPVEEAAAVLVSKLTESLASLQIETLAIVDFSAAGKVPSDLTGWLEDRVGRGLLEVLPDTILVERVRLDAVLKEQGLGASGLLDSTTTARIGMLLGVDVLITGSIRQVQEGALFVTLSAVDVRTGKVLAKPSVAIDRSSLAADRVELQRASVPNSLTGSKPLATYRVGSIQLEVTGIARRFDRKRATVSLRLVNLSQGEISVGIKRGGFGRGSANLIDEAGGSYLPIGDFRGTGLAGVTDKSKKSSFTRLPSGPTPFNMTFKANEGELILGHRFGLSFTLVLWTPDGQVRYLLSVEDLFLEE